MSHLLDKLRFFKTRKAPFADGHGVTTNEDRTGSAGSTIKLCAQPTA
jgi:nitrate reductase alpha subunit